MSAMTPARPRRINFGNANSSTFCELIATEVTTRTHCDPRDPQVAAISTTRRLDIRIEAHGTQFILHDQVENDWCDLDWNDQEELDLIAFGRAVVAIGTVDAYQSTVPVVLVVHDRPATPEQLDVATASSFDHVAEGSIDLPSGRLAVTSTEIGYDVPIEIPVAPGRYRVRAYYGALARRRGEALGERITARPDDGLSHYVVKLWPTDRKLRRRVLKRWDPAGSRPPADTSPAGTDLAGRSEAVNHPNGVEPPVSAAGVDTVPARAGMDAQPGPASTGAVAHQPAEAWRLRLAARNQSSAGSAGGAHEDPARTP